MNRDNRQGLIRSLVLSNTITSQLQVKEILKEQGIEVTQATISRDFEYLRISKVLDQNGKPYYAVEGEPSLPLLLYQFAITIEGSGSFCVVKTPPGAASVLAYAMDNAELDYVLATIQGDDTVLVVCREPFTGKQVAELLASIKQYNT